MSTLPSSSRELAAVRQAVSSQLQLPAIPRVVRTLIAQLKSPAVDIRKLVAELEQEPLLAARTLRMANSPYYCGRRSVASISDAVIVVGTGAIRTLVIAGGLSAAFVDVPGVNLRQFWTDASATGQAARIIARELGLDGEAAYLAGLLHASGHLILCQAYPEQMLEVLSSTPGSASLELAAAERHACGLAFPEVGAAWMDGLGFPTPVVEAVAYQLAPQAEADPLACVVHMAATLSRSREEGLDAEAALAAIDPDVAGLLSGNAARWHDAVRAQYDSLGEREEAA